MQLRIEVRLDSYNDPSAYGNLQLSETVQIDTPSFLEVAQILGQFHELAAKIERERKESEAKQ
jgi:hypothetical protein